MRDGRALQAAHNGTCPLCPKYIAKDRSRIIGLDVPLPPSLEQMQYVARLRARGTGS